MIQLMKITISIKESCPMLENTTAKKVKRTIIITLTLVVLSLIFIFCIYPPVIKPDIAYKKAESLLLEGNYSDAAEIFLSLGDFKNSPERLEHTYTLMKDDIYEYGIQLIKDGKKCDAAITLGKLGEYKDAKERSKSLWSEIVSNTTLSANYGHSIAIKNNGEIIATGANDFGQCDVENWSNIISVSAGWEHSVGLCDDGSVIATGSTQKHIEDWDNIVAIAAGGFHTIGLKSDGTVVAVGSNSEGQCNVENWKNIISISAGQRHTVGLCSDGTVVATGYNENGQCDVEDWQNVVFISATMYRTVGVKSDGTVVAVGDNDHGQNNVAKWENIVSVASTRDVTFGLKNDGTVVACGYNYKNICEIEDWRDIVAITTSGESVVGLTSGGYIVEKGIFRHAGFSNIRITDHMLNHVETLSSKITGVDFGEMGYIEYLLKIENDEINSGTNILKIYKNGAISLKRVNGRNTRLFLNEEEDIAKWNEETNSFALNINDDVSCEIRILDSGASLEITSGKCNWGIDGKYILKVTE